MKKLLLAAVAATALAASPALALQWKASGGYSGSNVFSGGNGTVLTLGGAAGIGATQSGAQAMSIGEGIAAPNGNLSAQGAGQVQATTSSNAGVQTLGSGFGTSSTSGYAGGTAGGIGGAIKGP